MDVRSLLNHDDHDYESPAAAGAAPRPPICRFGPFKAQPELGLQVRRSDRPSPPSTSTSTLTSSATSTSTSSSSTISANITHTHPHPHHTHQPHTLSRPLFLPTPQSRTSSYSSSASSTSSCSLPSISPPATADANDDSSCTSSYSSSSSAPSSHHHHHNRHDKHHRLHPRPSSCSESLLPPISTGVPPLVRSDSGDSDAAQSPLTPNSLPAASPPSLRQQRDSHLRLPPAKALSYAERSLPRPQLLSHASSSSSSSSPYSVVAASAPSGPPSSMDSFSALPGPGNAFHGDMTFSTNPMQPQPYFNPQLPLGAPTEQHQHQQQQQQHHQQQHQQQPAYPPNSASAPPKPAQKKNSYPCPLANQYGCGEHFTTSGHAARHAKKHTGKKDAICPECNKAFTRKDNMEQHRRTHSKESASSSSGVAARSSSKSHSDKDDSRQRKMLKVQHQQNKKQRPPPLSTSTSTSSPVVAQLSGNQPHSITSPSVSSAITSPIVDVPTPASLAHSVSAPVPMDMALDPRLRDGSNSAASASAPAFSPPGLALTTFSIPNTPNSGFAPQFNPMLPATPTQLQQQQFQIQQQQQQQAHSRHSSINLHQSPQMHTPMDPMMSQIPQSASAPRASFGHPLDFMSSAQMGLGVSINPSPSMDHSGPVMNMMMDANVMPMSMSPPTAVMVPGGDLQSPGLGMAPAMDRLALDKLAMAAEAASNGR